MVRYNDGEGELHNIMGDYDKSPRINSPSISNTWRTFA